MTSTEHSTRESTLARFLSRADRFAAVLDGAEGQWDAPTPCEGWTVRDVVAHVISTEHDFLARQGLLDPGTAEPTDFATHLRETADALAQNGVSDRVYDGYFGRTTIGATMADFYGWDLMVHGWDVAVATGQSHEISEAEAADMSATADGWGDALYGEGVCTAPVPVPDDAPAGHRLLGRLGRDPHWRP